MKLIQPARLRWTAQGQPQAADFDDCYFSAVNGLAETQHVFLAGNRLRERWQQLDTAHFVIGETGFGSGLNFVAAWQLWQQVAPTNAHLSFISAELHPLTPDDLQRCAALWPELASYYAQLIEQYPVLTPGFHTLHFGRVTLVLLLGNASEMFAQCEHAVDAWFLDGFAPAKNPALWNDSVITHLARLSKPGTTLATFSAAGHVRRSLQTAGFSVQKQPGFGNKRDMTTASLPSFSGSCREAMEGWHRIRHAPAPPSRVTIIGTGIAGSTLAHTLAQRGLDVTVIEQDSAPAQQASGNQQAILYSKWGLSDDELSPLNLSAYLVALRFYRDYQRCGVLQLAWNEDESAQQEKLRDFFTHYPDIAHFVTREEASVIAGIDVECGGLFFHRAGWLQPATVCAALLDHPRITAHFNTSLDTLSADEAVVICAGHLTNTWPQTQHLPLKMLRGQVTHGKPTAFSRQLKTVLSGDGYVAPALDSLQSFGATYTPQVNDLSVTAHEHRENRDKLAKSSATLAQQWHDDETIIGGRAHFRAAAPDYLPLCGPVPDLHAFTEDYALLRKNARRVIPLAGRYHPHLYVCAGFGSRGMVYAPLCAEVIASYLLQTPAPLPTSLMVALNPARFVIRDLMKNRL